MSRVVPNVVPLCGKQFGVQLVAQLVVQRP